MDPISLSLKVPAIDKLIDYGANGVRAIAGPLLAPWKASREGKARLTAAKVDAQIREIQVTSDASALNVIAEAQIKAREYLLPADADIHAKLDITPQDIAQSFEFQGRKRLANARAVLEAAADELGDKEVDDHEPDPDWTARLFDIVQDVSSEDLQKIYAKILAGEVESAGRTSLRTLDVLRNMTKRDAEMFRDVCCFVLGEGWIFFDTSFTKDIDALQYSNVLDLQEFGLVTLQTNLGTYLYLESKRYGFLPYLNRDIRLWIEGDEKAPDVLGVPSVVLTTAGRELFQVVEGTPKWEYLQAFAKFLESKNCRLKYLGGGVQLPDGRTQYKEIDFIQISSSADPPEEFPA